MVYWWNPLLIKEFANSAHVDALLITFLLGVLLLTLKRKTVGACVCLAAAVGIKIWPLLLLPIVLKASVSGWRARVRGFLLFAILVGLQSLPILISGGNDSGFLAYAGIWEMNDALFMAIRWGVQRAVDLFSLGSEHVAMTTRVGVGLLTALVASLVSLRARVEDHSVVFAFLLITACVFALSPTQFPWYYTWVVAFLVLRSCFALVLLTPLLSLYYTRFYFDARDQVDWFDFGVVWLEYIPVWLAILWQGVRVWKRESLNA